MKPKKYFSQLVTIFALIVSFSSIAFGDSGSNDSCNGELISEINAISTTTSHTESGTLYDGGGPDDDDDYYYFKPGVDGTLSVSYSSDENTDLYISTVSCGNNRVMNNGTSYSNSSISISSTQTIYIRIKRERNNRTTTYSLPITFTIAVQAPPVMGNIPNQTANVSTSFELKLSDYVTLTNGDAISSYTLTGSLPSGLSFNSTTGIISGTPTATASAITFSATATDNDGASNSDDFTITVEPQVTETTGGRNFIQRTQENLFGDVKVIGNTVLCILKNGSCIEPTSTSNSNADTNLQKAPISYSTLTLPTNSTIEYARLYWQGRKAATSNNTAWDGASKASASTINIRKGNSGNFTALTADIKDFDSTSSNNYVRVYSASADASSIVDGSGTYYIDTANFYTETGETNDKNPSDGLGAYGAWVLVVVYKDPYETKARNITIFDGYKKVVEDDVIDVPVSGFLTPRTGSVDSKVYVFTAEGDKYLAGTGDVIKMAGATHNTTLKTLGTFDSRVDVLGTRSPSLTNNNGIDIHKYDTGTTSGALNIITTNETGAKFRFTSDQDTYFPSLIVFSTELYLPQMCYDYSIRQDGHYLSVDRDAYPIAHLDSKVSSSPLEIAIYLKNQEADIVADGIAIKADVNDTIFDQVGNIYTSNINGTTLIDRGAPTLTSPLCGYDKNGNNLTTNNGCTNGHDIRKGNGSLDAGDYVYTKFKIQPKNISGISTIDEPLGLSLKYYITVGGNKVEYPDYLLGSVNVPLCPPTTSYQPAWGQFNVVQSGQPNGSIMNNINTQISRNPFNATVVFDSTPLTGNNEAPTTDINTTVLVEMIDMDPYGDINASCANPDSSLSVPIFVPINFTPANYQANIPTQSSDYYNFAVKNSAFRVWYFTDQNGTLIQNWNATTINNNKTLSNITGLYDSTIHPQCAVSCSTPTSTTCFTCIKDNYARPLCSRDNFSIRPESYDLRIFDVDKELPDYDIVANPGNLKNITKVDLSTIYGYSPVTSPSSRMNLAAGYNYRFDINATGHDGLSSVPGYTRIFNDDPDYKASLIWDPQSVKTGCNDINNTDIVFYVANGSMQNEERNKDQVGEYKLNITDKSWTAVDWQDQRMTHHDTSANGGFLIGKDCLLDPSSSTSGGVIYGCTIKTNHGSDGGGRTYKDHALTFNPYKFDMGAIIASRGVDNNTTFDANSFIYMSDMSTNDDMAFHLYGFVRAFGENNTPLSNFVENCYAKPINMTINKSAISGAVAYQSTFNTFNETNTSNLVSVAIPPPTVPWIRDMNTSLQSVWTVPVTSFDKDMNGSIHITQNLNFDRNSSVVMNPEKLTFTTYDSNCTISADCTMNADLVLDYKTKGTRVLDLNVTHLYGRTHASRQRYTVPTDAPYEANIYYETYCFGTIPGIFTNNICKKELLPNPTGTLKRTDDIRWFINESHSITNDGNVTMVVQKGGTNIDANDIVDALDNPPGNNPSITTLSYDASKGFPYKTTMENNASVWLIYNEMDPTATRNQFAVEFDIAATGWSGEHETNTTTKNVGAVKTNRRSMW